MQTVHQLEECIKILRKRNKSNKAILLIALLDAMPIVIVTHVAAKHYCGCNMCIVVAAITWEHVEVIRVSWSLYGAI